MLARLALERSAVSQLSITVQVRFRVTAMIVEMAISADTLAGALANMRNWLDANRCTPVLFQTKSSEQPGVILIRVEFAGGADAEAFRRAFDVGASDVPSVAA
jgi:hypothetical protein